MDGSKAIELVEVGSKIVALGGELETLRAQRDELVKKVAALEAEMNPLLIKHSQLVASLAGRAFPAPAVPVPENPGVGDTPQEQTMSRKFIVEKKVRQILANVQTGDNKGSEEIAVEIREDPVLVREVMREMMQGVRR